MHIGKRFACLFLSLFFAFSLFGCSGSGTGSTLTTDISMTIGRSISIEDLKFTLYSTESTAFVEDYDSAPYGEEYFFVALEVENNSDQSIEISSSDFAFYVDGTEAEQPSFSTYRYDDFYSLSLLDGLQLEAGRKSAFYLVATVPESCDLVKLTYQGAHTFQISRKPSSSSSESNLPASSSSGAADSAATDTPPTYSVGETFSNSGFEITLTQAIQTDRLENSGFTYYAPDAGNHYVFFIFDIKNTSSTAAEFDYSSYFTAYTDDYSTMFVGFFAETFNGYKDLNTLQYIDILPDKSLTGFCALEVPDGWGTIELIARNGTFVITPADVTIQ